MVQQPIQLFVVDFDRLSSEAARQVASSQGYEVTLLPVTGNVVGVIEDYSLRSQNPFVILVRADMPVSSGGDIIRKLRDGPASSVGFRALLMASDGDIDHIRPAVNAGLDKLLPSHPSREELEQAFIKTANELISDQSKKDRIAELVALVCNGGGAIIDGGALGADVAADGDDNNSNVAYFPAKPADQTTLHIIDKPLKKVTRPDLSSHEDRLALIKVTQFIRRVRDRLVPACAEGDPSWEIFLYVMEQAELKNPVSVTAACHASAIPQTTAMRKIDELVAEGLLSRVSDPLDRRRINLEPTETGEAQLHAFLQDALAYMQTMFGLPEFDGRSRQVVDELSHAAE